MRSFLIPFCRRIVRCIILRGGKCTKEGRTRYGKWMARFKKYASIISSRPSTNLIPKLSHLALIALLPKSVFVRKILHRCQDFVL